MANFTTVFISLLPPLGLLLFSIDFVPIVFLKILVLLYLFISLLLPYCLQKLLFAFSYGWIVFIKVWFTILFFLSELSVCFVNLDIIWFNFLFLWWALAQLNDFRVTQVFTYGTMVRFLKNNYDDIQLE